MSITKKNRTTSLPDTVFLRGKVIILYRESKKSSDWDTCSREAVKWSRMLSTGSKVQTIVNCQRRSGREKSTEAWPSTGRSLQDISDMPLWLRKMLIKHSFRGLADRQNAGRVFHVALRSAGARLRGKWSKVTARALYFLHGAEKTLLSCYRRRKKNDVKWSDNALTKPVIRACLLWAEKYRRTTHGDNMH